MIFLLSASSALALAASSAADPDASGKPPVTATHSVIAAAAAGAAAAADAAEATTIVVTGQRLEYGVRSTSTATRTNTNIRNIPQALTIISESQIEDQALRSISEVLYFVPGATPGTGEANRDQMTLRGNNSTADFFVDGLRDDAQYFRDLYNVDRVEILRGPNAMIFGRGGGGGVVNRVLKRSSLRANHDFIAASDEHGGVRLAGDVDQPLAAGFGVRVNGMFEKGESFRRNVDLERYGFAPTLGVALGDATRIDLGYEFFHDRRTTDRGVPSKDGRPVSGFTRTFFGDPDDSFSKANVNSLNLGLEHRFGTGLTLRNRTLLADYDKFYQNIYPATAVLAADGALPEGPRLGAYNSRNDRTNLISQTDLVYEGRLAGIDQTLLAGVELARQRSRNQRLSGTVVGVPGGRVALSDPTVDVDVVYAPLASDANNRAKASIAAVYAQTQLRPSDKLEIVAGLRFDRLRLSINDLRPGIASRFTRTDNLISPRLGLIFKPRRNLSLYGGYSRSYLPQSGDQFSGLSSVTESLKPERFDNIEIGAKWEPMDGLLATAAIYQLDRTNTQARDQNDLVVLTGAQRSRGLELGLERSISSRWQVSAGYAWQKAKITKTTSAAPAGREVALVPRHQFSLWSRYDVTPSMGLGVGLIARSKSFASISNQVRLPGYTRADAALYYKLPHGIQAQLNVENLLGARYFPTAHNDNNIAPGAPRTIRGTLRFEL
jgi:catecholate siderophore receptor